MSYEALISELTSISKGSRELDAKIDCIARDRITHPKLPVGYTMVDRGDAILNTRGAVSPFLLATGGPAPAYTRMLDAAMMLIPRDATNEITGTYDWQLESTNGGMTISARVGPEETRSFANTPALAICIASLKARS
jgi:hypothetical protein